MKKIFLIFSILFVVLMVSVYFIYWPKARFNLAKEVVADGGFPTQLGLTGVAVGPCMQSCYVLAVPTCCTITIPYRDTGLCATKTVADCPLYSVVAGTMAGGTNDMGIFTKVNIGIAGVSSGGQILAGGMSPALMDSGVLAGVGGCVGSGCVAINNKNIFERYYEIAKYAIAKIKD